MRLNTFTTQRPNGWLKVGIELTYVNLIFAGSIRFEDMALRRSTTIIQKKTRQIVNLKSFVCDVAHSHTKFIVRILDMFLVAFFVSIFGSGRAYGCDDDFSFRSRNQIRCSFFALVQCTHTHVVIFVVDVMLWLISE